jgi:hypothetical protein
MRPFQKWLLIYTSALTGLTGVVYLWMDRMMLPIDEFAVINHPLQPWVLKAHIIVAPALVFAIGLIATDHVWKHYRTRERRARRTGSTAMWVLPPMILSGYLIQATTRPTLLAVVAWTHIATGVLYLAAVAAHQLVMSRRTNGVARDDQSDEE